MLLVYIVWACIIQLGCGGVGYIWSSLEGSNEEEWRYSVAPISADRLAQMVKEAEDDLECPSPDGNTLFPGEQNPTKIADSEEDEGEDSKDEYAYFEKEVQFM